MRDTDYAFCVARLRANEKYMLDESDMLKLCECKNYDRAIEILREKKWIDEGQNIGEFISYQNKKLWNLLWDCVPDRNELKALCIQNDFFNIKVAVKCHFTSDDALNYYAYPTTFDTEKLTCLVNLHNFKEIGGIMGECAEKSYKAACLTENGQNLDIIVDCAAVTALKKYADENKKTLLGEISAFICDTANIKTAYRCAKTKKGEDFVDAALGESCFLNRGVLIKACLESEQAVSDYLEKTRYKSLSEKYRNNAAGYEKECDDEIMSKIQRAKFTSFGFDPVCAYYYAKQNEIKSVRIILNALGANIPPEDIKQRVRALYV